MLGWTLTKPKISSSVSHHSRRPLWPLSSLCLLLIIYVLRPGRMWQQFTSTMWWMKVSRRVHARTETSAWLSSSSPLNAQCKNKGGHVEINSSAFLNIGGLIFFYSVATTQYYCLNHYVQCWPPSFILCTVCRCGVAIINIQPDNKDQEAS